MTDESVQTLQSAHADIGCCKTADLPFAPDGCENRRRGKGRLKRRDRALGSGGYREPVTDNRYSHLGIIPSIIPSDAPASAFPFAEEVQSSYFRENAGAGAAPSPAAECRQARENGASDQAHPAVDSRLRCGAAVVARISSSGTHRCRRSFPHVLLALPCSRNTHSTQ